jgi:hypothetical protein
MTGARTRPTPEPTADRGPTALVRLSPLVWLFLAVALLALPIFAHGCHGDDVDHEPLLIPSRLFSDDP